MKRDRLFNLAEWKISLKISWYPFSLWLTCNDSAWVTPREGKKGLLWTERLTLSPHTTALITPVATNITYLLFKSHIISPLGKKNKLKCWQIFFPLHPTIMFWWLVSEVHCSFQPPWHSVKVKALRPVLINWHYPQISLMKLRTYS